MYSSRLVAALALCASLVSGQEGTTTQTSTMTRTMTLIQCNPTMVNCPLKSASSFLVESSPTVSAAVETTAPAMPTGMPSELLPPALPEAPVPVTSILLSSSIMAPSVATSLPAIESSKPMNQSSTNRWSVSNATMNALPSGTGSVPTMLTTSRVPSETTEGAISSATAPPAGPRSSANAFRASGSLLFATLLAAVAASF